MKCPCCKGKGHTIYKPGEVMDEGFVWVGLKPTKDVCNICHGTGQLEDIRKQ